MPHGSDLMYVDNELEQLTRALASSSGHNFLAACEESAHGSTDIDLPTVPAARLFPDPLQQLARAAMGSNVFELGVCEKSASVSPELHEVQPPAMAPSCSPSCACKSCVWLDDIFSSNRRWAKGLSRINPNFFADMAQEDTPSLLWIGCADSRVVPNRVTGLQPGSLYVHRNVGNVAKPCDPNCMSALEYSVNSLQVQHVVVCGHYGCSAVTAAMKDPSKTAGILNFWVSDIRQLLQQHQQELQAMSQERQLARLCELNVVRQVMNICNSAVVRAAWGKGQAVHVHGLVYDVKTGLLKRLVDPVSSPDEDFAVLAAAEQLHENQEMAAAFSAATQELLRAQGYTLPEAGMDAANFNQVPSSPARSLARAAAAMQQRAPGSIPSTPRGSSVNGSELAAVEPAIAELLCAAVSDDADIQTLQEELAWLRSSEACAVDAAQHLMEQTRALLKEKQETSKKLAEQSETIKWLEERLQFLESESEHLRASAPTQLIKRFRELHNLPSESLSPDLQEELHLLQGLMALGSQLYPSPTAAPSFRPALPWDKSSDIFRPPMDMHFNPTTVPVWNYTVQDLHPHDQLTLKQQKHATLPTAASKVSLLDQFSHSPMKNHKAPAPDPSPLPSGPTPALPDPATDVTPIAGTEPDLWYLLGAYAPSHTSSGTHASHGSQSQPAGVSSPSSHSLPPSSVLSPRDSLHPRGTAPAHYRMLSDSVPSTSASGSASGNEQEKGDETKAVVDAANKQPWHLAGSEDGTPATDNYLLADAVAAADADYAIAAAAADVSNGAGAHFSVAGLPDLHLKVPTRSASVDEAQEIAAQEETTSLKVATAGVYRGLNSTLSLPGSPGGVSVVGTLPLSESYWELPELPEWLRAAAAELQAARSSSVMTYTPRTEAGNHQEALAKPAQTKEPLNQQSNIVAADAATDSAAVNTNADHLNDSAAPQTMSPPSAVQPSSSAVPPPTAVQSPSVAQLSSAVQPPAASQADHTSSTVLQHSHAPPSAAPGHPTSSTPVAAVSVRAALPPLPPKKVLSLRSGSGHSKKRVVVKLGLQTGEHAQSGRSRKEKKRSSRSRTSSVASTASCLSIDTSEDFPPGSYTANALQQMAEDLRRLEDALWEEDDNFPHAVQLQQQLQHQLTGARKRSGQHAKGKGQLQTANRPHYPSNNAKVTFSQDTSTTPECVHPDTFPSPPHSASPSKPPTTTLPAPSQNTTTIPAFQFPQPTAQMLPPHSSALLPIPEEQSQQAQHPAFSPQLSNATHQAITPSAPSHNNNTKQRGGGWLGAVGRATLAVAVGVLLKRST